MSNPVRIEPQLLAPLLPRRDAREGKWHYGRALLLCGCEEMSGAALLSCEAALRSGAGLVQLAAVPAVIAAARPRLPEALLLAVHAEREAFLGPDIRIAQAEARANAVLFGCGVGLEDSVRALLRQLCAQTRLPLVLDADGLNLLSEQPELLSLRPERTILTPHAGEFCRLSGKSRAALATDPVGLATDFARKYGVILVLKGATTIVTDGTLCAMLDAPNSGLAKGGSGDLLAGLTVGLLAQGIAPFAAASLAVWLQARAGALACAEQSAYSVLPSDLFPKLGQAFCELADA